MTDLSRPGGRSGQSLLLGALLCLWPLACDNTRNTPIPVDGAGAVNRPLHMDGSTHADLALEALGPQCRWPTTFDSGVGCVATRAFVSCTEAGGTVTEPSADPTGCLACNGTCREFCTLSEYSLSCNGALQLDAATSSESTDGCHVAFVFASGPVTYCCPCQ